MDSRIEKTGDSPTIIIRNALELRGSKGRCYKAQNMSRALLGLLRPILAIEHHAALD